MDVDHIIGDAIVSAQSDAIIAADKEGAIIFWSPGAERIFGFAKAEAIGRSLDIIIPTRLRKRHWDGYRKVMASGESRYGQGNVLAVPVNALVARRGGGYGVELATGHRIVPVHAGMFADGYVEVSGAAIREGTRVVVPRE